MRKVIVWLFILAYALSAMAPHSCATTVLGDGFEQTYPIEATAKIIIRNRGGSILVYGGPPGEVKISALKRAYTQTRLADIAVTVSRNAGEISIDTRYPTQPKWGLSDRAGTVDYVITVPVSCNDLNVELGDGEILVDGVRCGMTKTKLGNGRLFLRNCFGNLRISVGQGGFDATWDWWEGAKSSLDAEIMNGNGNLRVPTGAALHLFAVSVNGKIATNLAAPSKVEESGSRTIDTLIGGSPQTEIKLKATNGNLQINALNP